MSHCVLNILNRLRVDDPRVKSQAMEYLRLLELKIPVGSLKKAECARAAIVTDFACRNLQVAYDKKKIIECGMLSVKDYNLAFTRCKNVLQLEFQKTSILDTLLIYTGYQDNIRRLAERILEVYREKATSKLINSDRNIDFKSDVYEASAFKLACKIKHLPCNRKDVLSLSCLEAGYFDRIYSSLSVAVSMVLYVAGVLTPM